MRTEGCEIIKTIITAPFFLTPYIEGKDAKVGAGGVLRFDDHSDKEVHSIAKELCNEGILDFHIGVTLPVYYLRGERP